MTSTSSCLVAEGNTPSGPPNRAFIACSVSVTMRARCAGSLKRLQHRVAAAVLRPGRDHQRAESRLAGKIRIRVGSRVAPAPGRVLHHREQPAGVALLEPLRLHVRDDRHEARLLPDGDRLGDADPRAEVRLRRQAIVIREVRAPVFAPARRRGRLPRPGRSTPACSRVRRRRPRRPRSSPLDDQRAHALDLLRRRAPIGGAHHLRPDAVEPDVGADVERQAAGAGARELLRQSRTLPPPSGFKISVVTPCVSMFSAVGKRIGRRVAVDVDEAGRHVQAGRVDLLRRARRCQVADARDEPVRRSPTSAR